MFLRAGLLAVAALMSVPAQAERRGTFDQIDLPHPYYFRELYLPQLTEGPSGLAFSPDSAELVYSAGGSLWRQKIDTGIATQLTDDASYDYQPDWSPDGRELVYTSYRQGALELRLLDLASGVSTALTSGGAVNVEPRFSPDGKRIAFVSTAGTGHFHIFVMERKGGAFGAPVQFTGETRSELPRYYYSRIDHEINPAWTPDGQHLVFVSNRGHIHGTGGFWTMEARPGAPATEIHYEETNWRARPEPSPDGSRILYSSYLGRNWLQLWMLPAQGGTDAIPISFGDFDQTAARFSPDGRWIGYVSNADGTPRLWLMRTQDAQPRALAIDERRWMRPHGRLRLHLAGADGRAACARVSVDDAQGKAHAPRGAWMRGDDGFDRKLRPFEVHYFHACGSAELDLPAGEAHVEVVHGLRQALVTLTPLVPAGGTVEARWQEHPWSDAAEGGGRWVSGDVHVHMNYAGTYIDTPERLVVQARGEDLGLVNALVVNKEQRVPDSAWGGHGLDPASVPEARVLHGQEFHSSYWGHLGILGPDAPTLLPGYVGYPNTAAASLAPDNSTIADLAHARGALVGYVHPFDDEPHPFDAGEPLSYALPVDVALGKVDYLEILGFSDHRITAGVWYRLLNLGFHIPAAGGTDAMANYASMRGPVGMNRTFVRVPDKDWTERQWLEGLRAGRSFATNGPLLEFTLGGADIGDERNLPPDGASLEFTGRVRSIVPVDHVELVCNGSVVQSAPLIAPSADVQIRGRVGFTSSGWCVLRASTDGARHPVLDNYVYATTSPIYVNVGGVRPFDPEQARYFTAWIDRVLERTRAYPDWNSAQEKAEVVEHLERARSVYAGSSGAGR